MQNITLKRAITLGLLLSLVVTNSVAAQNWPSAYPHMATRPDLFQQQAFQTRATSDRDRGLWPHHHFVYGARAFVKSASAHPSKYSWTRWYWEFKILSILAVAAGLHFALVQIHSPLLDNVGYVSLMGSILFFGAFSIFWMAVWRFTDWIVGWDPAYWDVQKIKKFTRWAARSRLYRFRLHLAQPHLVKRVFENTSLLYLNAVVSALGVLKPEDALSSAREMLNEHTASPDVKGAGMRTLLALSEKFPNYPGAAALIQSQISEANMQINHRVNANSADKMGAAMILGAAARSKNEQAIKAIHQRFDDLAKDGEQINGSIPEAFVLELLMLHHLAAADRKEIAYVAGVLKALSMTGKVDPDFRGMMSKVIISLYEMAQKNNDAAGIEAAVSAAYTVETGNAEMDEKARGLFELLKGKPSDLEIEAGAWMHLQDPVTPRSIMNYLILEHIASNREALKRVLFHTGSPIRNRLYALGLLVRRHQDITALEDVDLNLNVKEFLSDTLKMDDNAFAQGVLDTPGAYQELRILSIASTLHASQGSLQNILSDPKVLNELIGINMRAEPKWGWENANSNFVLGTKFFRELGAAGSLAVLDHETMHNILHVYFHFFGDTLSRQAIHEQMADLFMRSNALRLGIKTDALFLLWRAEAHAQKWMSQGWGNEEHHVARAQEAIIEKALGGESNREEFFLHNGLRILNTFLGKRLSFYAFNINLLSLYQTPKLQILWNAYRWRSPRRPPHISKNYISLVKPDTASRLLRRAG